MAGESQCGACGSFYHCFMPGSKGCRKRFIADKPYVGLYGLEMSVAHPTESIIKSLENEIRTWCENHGVEIREMNLTEIG